jgi:hypothetical protein
MLQRCLALREALERFEAVEGEDLAQTLARYDEAVAAQRWDDFVDDYNRLYDSLPKLEERLEQQLAAAAHTPDSHAKRRKGIQIRTLSFRSIH